MGKKSKGIEQVQDQILNQFEHVKRAYSRKDRVLSISEKLILEGQQNRKRFEELRKKESEKPQFSFYQPNNILNRIKHMEPEQGQRVLKAYLQEQKKLNKSTTESK